MTSILTLNVELSAHFPQVADFLKLQNQDVLTLQELTEADFQNLKTELGYNGVYISMVGYSIPRQDIWGVAILSKLPIITHIVKVYDQFNQDYPEHDRRERPLATLLAVQLEHQDGPFWVGCTHFTWTPDGQSSPEQRVNLGAFLDSVKGLTPLVFCGDFNAPRGGEIYSTLATQYHDAVPANITTTIDADLHRAGNLQLVVDYIFHDDACRVDQVEVLGGVSDHMAVKGDIRLV